MTIEDNKDADDGDDDEDDNENTTINCWQKLGRRIREKEMTTMTMTTTTMTAMAAMTIKRQSNLGCQLLSNSNLIYVVQNTVTSLLYCGYCGYCYFFK